MKTARKILAVVGTQKTRQGKRPLVISPWLVAINEEARAPEKEMVAGEDGCAYNRRESHISLSLLFHTEEDTGTTTDRRTLGWQKLVGTGAGRDGE